MTATNAEEAKKALEEYLQIGLTITNNDPVKVCNGNECYVVAHKEDAAELLHREPIAIYNDFLVFPGEPRDTNFYFCIYSKEYGYTEVGPFGSYADAQAKIHEFKARVMSADDGVNRFYSDAYSKESDDPLITWKD